ncbi:MAG: hypothetical protein AMXMBFR64_05930 [Myxococcales bacterium]
MAMITSGSPAPGVTASTTNPGRGAEVQRVSPGGELPQKRSEQVATSLQEKDGARQVSADLSKQVGGIKSQEEGRFDRSPEKGIDKVSVSAQAMAAARASKPKTEAVDSAAKPMIDGAPGSFAGLPRTEAEDPTRSGREAAALARQSSQPKPADGISPLFSARPPGLGATKG